MIISPAQIQIAEDRRQVLLAMAARGRLGTAASQPSPAAPPRTVGRFGAGLRQAIAALLALAAIN